MVKKGEDSNEMNHAKKRYISGHEPENVSFMLDVERNCSFSTPTGKESMFFAFARQMKHSLGYRGLPSACGKRQ